MKITVAKDQYNGTNREINIIEKIGRIQSFDKLIDKLPDIKQNGSLFKITTQIP